MKEKLAVQFSGGRTSAFMCQWLLKNVSDKYDMVFCFQNTGQEHENTLKFVDQCDKEFGLNLFWIEADIKQKGTGTNYKIVNYETASRDGKPYEDMVKKFGLPNMDFPHCTRELKIEPFKKWAEDHIGTDYKIALGLRNDEPSRVKKAMKNKKIICPLAIENPITKGDVLIWFRNNNFDLELHEHLGNCTWCWKKSDDKLRTLMIEYPLIFDFPKMLEEKYSFISNFDRKDKRAMFREYRTTSDILELSKLPFKVFKENQKLKPSLNICAEECGSFIDWISK
jgi:hypothetical protein